MAAAINIEDPQPKIEAFVSKWQTKLFQSCKGNNQKLACWYLWLRYLLSLRSLRHLCAANDLCGCLTMARCWLEYDIAIAAIAKKPELGDSYIQYDVHAKNRHLEHMKRSDETWKTDELQQYMISRFGPDFAKHRKLNWHGGFRNLCDMAGCDDDLTTYHVLSQHVHGTISGMYALNMLGVMGKHKSPEFAIQVLEIYTLRYLKATERIIQVLCRLWTPTKGRCKQDLDGLANDILGLA